MIKIIIIANLQSRKDRMNGKYIKEIADRKDMSIYRLEKESGVSAGRIWRIIKGETKNPSIDNLIQIADALDVTLIDKKVLIVRFFVYFKLQNNYRGDETADKV